MKMMYSDIIDNWEAIHDEEEKRILQKYSNRGRMLTIVYLGKIVFEQNSLYSILYTRKLRISSIGPVVVNVMMLSKYNL